MTEKRKTDDESLKGAVSVADVLRALNKGSFIGQAEFVFRQDEHGNFSIVRRKKAERASEAKALEDRFAALEAQIVTLQGSLARVESRLESELENRQIRIIAGEAATSATVVAQLATAGISSQSSPMPESNTEDDAPFVVHPWPYLCAMANVALGAFFHPFRTTVVDLETGRVVDRY
jgi:TolA-binding protein